MSAPKPAPWLAAVLVFATAGAVRRAAWSRSPVRRRLARLRALRAGTQPHAHAHAAGRGPRLRAPDWARARLTAALPGWDADVAWTAWLAVAALSTVVGWAVGGPTLAVLAAAGVAAGPPMAEAGLRRRAMRHAAMAVPEAMETAARALRAGASLPAALSDAAAAGSSPIVATVLADIATAAARGQPLVDALEERRADDSGVPGLRLAFTALALAAETGGPQAAALDGVAATLRQRLAARAEAVALGSQARTSALVIALAPPGFAVLSSAADRRNAEFLLRTPLGVALLALGLALDGAGVLWMTRLARIGGPP